MSVNSTYEIGACYYDATYEVRQNRKGDIGFYGGLAAEHGGPVLELGCGTGRVLLPIAASGLCCTGVDVSDAMLDEFRRKPGASEVELVRAPMESFALSRSYSLIYAAFRSFQHLDSERQQLDCLACVRLHLAPGGVFAFDVMNPEESQMANKDEPEWISAEFQHAGNTIKRYVRVTRDSGSQILRVSARFERNSPNGQLPDESLTYTLRWFLAQQLESLLQRAGFKDIAFYGNFERHRLTPKSPAIVVLAR